VEFVLRCEEPGFHGVGVHDHHHSGRDVYVTLALAAFRTSDRTLYPATSNTVTRWGSQRSPTRSKRWPPA
jgi:5,10-methylenetetrahydromethanopterin reductase